MYPDVESFFHEPTWTWTHLLVGADGRTAALIDPVLDYEARAGRTSTTAADRLLARVRERGLSVAWLLETHAHADHLSAADYLKGRLGARTGIGTGITRVQEHFRDVFNLGAGFPVDGRQFDRLLAHGDCLDLGGLAVTVMATPGHTSDSISFLAGQSAFVGDTLFAPDYGTARCDFPGGDPAALFASVQSLYELAGDTRLYLCHDYPTEGREPMAWATVAEQRTRNPHLSQRTTLAGFVRLRQERDRAMHLPELIIPSVQVNIRAGQLPEPAANGVRYLQVPLNLLGRAP